MIHILHSRYQNSAKILHKTQLCDKINLDLIVVIVSLSHFLR